MSPIKSNWLITLVFGGELVYLSDRSSSKSIPKWVLHQKFRESVIHLDMIGTLFVDTHRQSNFSNLLNLWRIKVRVRAMVSRRKIPKMILDEWTCYTRGWLFSFHPNKHTSKRHCNHPSDSSTHQWWPWHFDMSLKKVWLFNRLLG